MTTTLVQEQTGSDISDNNETPTEDEGSGIVTSEVNKEQEEVDENEELYEDDLIKTQDQKRVDQVNEDKEIGNKVVQAEDTDSEDITEGALEGPESIDKNCK